MSQIAWHPSVRNKHNLKNIKVKHNSINCCYHDVVGNEGGFFIYDNTVDSKEKYWKYVKVEIGKEFDKLKDVESWPYNENKVLTDEQQNDILGGVEIAVNDLLRALRIETKNNVSKTIANMYVKDLFRGRYEPMPFINIFPNTIGYDQIRVTGPIDIVSTSPHTFQKITGKCWIGIYSENNIFELSDLNSLVDWIARRPQKQEEMIVQIVDLITEQTKSDGVAVLLNMENNTTTAFRGVFLYKEAFKSSFFSMIHDTGELK